MKKFKKKLIMFLVLVLWVTTVIPVCAATQTQDGVEITLNTDKQKYDSDEEITVSVTAKNTNNWAVEDVSVECVIPKGYEAEGDVSLTVPELKGYGDTATLTVVLVPKTSISPATGDNSNIWFWSILLILIAGALVGVCVAYRKRGNRVFSMFLCVTLILTSLQVSALEVQAADDTYTISTSETIEIGNEKLIIEGKVAYTILGSDDEASSENSETEENVPESGEPVESTPEFSEPEESTGESSKPEESTPESGEPEESTGESSEPEESTPESSEPEESTPESSEPEESTPESSEPEESTPESSEPEESTPESSEPEESTLISYWDFEGSDTTEKLTDKATAGKTTEMITLSGDASVSSGILKVNDTVNGYAAIACDQEESDLYDLTNKTIIIKARISNNESAGNNMVSGLLSKQSAYTLYFDNAKNSRVSRVIYKVPDNTKNTIAEVIESTTAVEEWRVYAFSVEFNEETQSGKFNVWKSLVENPTSEADYQQIVSQELSSMPETLFEGTDALYLGKRYDHLSKQRTLISEFSVIQVHNKALALDEIAIISKEFAEEPEEESTGGDGALISSWDFKGSNETEMLTDKATEGKTLETITLSGGASVSSGILRVEDTVNGYAAIACNQEASDLYDLTNKTIVLKARIFNNENETLKNNVASLLSKKSGYSLNVSNAVTKRYSEFMWNVDGVNNTIATRSYTAVDEWIVYAIAVEFNDETQSGKLNVWKSLVENPVSKEDYQLIVSQDLSSASGDLFEGNDALYLGKRYSHLAKQRTLISEFSAIQVYDKALTIDEVAELSVGTEMDASKLSSELQELITTADAMTQGIHSDEEWAKFTSVLSTAKSLNAESSASDLQTAIQNLRRQIVLLTINQVPTDYVDITMIPYNNSDKVVPIDVGGNSFPGFCDIDGDGDLDLVASGTSLTYGGTAGGMFAFRNLNNTRGTTEFGQAELLFNGAGYVWWSYKKDGSPVFVDANGVMHGSVDNQGYEKGNEVDRLNTLFKLYDMDGDNLSDAVLFERTKSGTAEYDNEGKWLQEFTYTFKWIKNTGTEENPDFSGEKRTISNSKGTEFTIDDSTQYASVRSFCMFDWDKDGDLDLIAGGWLNEFDYYENKGNSETPVFDNVGVKIETRSGILQLDCCRYNAINYDWDGDGLDDLLIGGESGTMLYLQFTGSFSDTTGAPVFEEGVYFSNNASYLSVNALSRPTSCDWDGDGDEDMIVGDNGGFLWFLENLTGGTNPSWDAPVKMTDEEGTPLEIKAGPSGSLQGDLEQEWGYLVPSACDWDGDGDIDIIVNSVTGRVVWFENIGTSKQGQLTQHKAIEVEWENENLYPSWQWWTPDGNELVTQHRSTVYAIDLNSDSLCDLVMLDHEGYLAFFERYSENGELKLKQGQRIFLNEDSTPLQLNNNTGGQSGRKKFVVTDWNCDGMLDVIQDDKSFVLYETARVENGNYYLKSKVSLSTGNISGHNHGFTMVNWDNDGDYDIVTGTEAGYLYYLENKTIDN